MTTELAHVHDGEAAKPDVIRPVATAAALLETFQAYQKLERALLVDDVAAQRAVRERLRRRQARRRDARDDQHRDRAYRTRGLQAIH